MTAKRAWACILHSRVGGSCSRGKNNESSEIPVFFLLVLTLSSVVGPYWFPCGSGSRILGHAGYGSRVFICNFIYHKASMSSKLQEYRRSLQPSKENIQHFKTCNFFTFSTFFVLDPDPEDQNQSGSTTLLLNPLMYCKCTPMLRCRGIVVATFRSNRILSRDK